MPVRIVEWQLPYTWGTGIGIDTNKVISVLLREENNLIQVNGDNELYTDLQLVSNIRPTDTFPVWVTTGRVLQSNWWIQSGLILNRKTTSGDYARWIYANDWKIYFDKWTWVWNQVYYSSEVDNLIQNLRNYVDNNFQEKLIAWDNITIENNVISSTWWGGWADIDVEDKTLVITEGWWWWGGGGWWVEDVLVDWVSVVTNDVAEINLSWKQNVSNLVTSVSSASTDSQYPSAKLFYDTCWDIETLINAL
jgi:hypothetical protein